MNLQYSFIPLAQAAEANVQTLKLNGFSVNIWWWPYLFFTVQYFLIFLTIIYIVGIVLVTVRAQRLTLTVKEAVAQAMETGKLSQKRVQEDWSLIETDVESENPHDFKRAAVAAEKLFDHVLKSSGYAGENLEMRLGRISDKQLEFKEDIIWAYKLKNTILTNPAYEVDHEEARRAIYIFQRALREVGIL